MELYPSILTDRRAIAVQQLQQVSEDDRLKTVQIDIIDGWFADNVTLTPLDFVELEFGQVDADFHLMTEEPLDYVFELMEIGKALPTHGVIGQVERMSNIELFVDQVKRVGWMVGLSLDLFTPVEAIEIDELSQLDTVQVMTIEAGFQGQQFVQAALEKVDELVALRKQRELSFQIMVDGGIKPELIKLLTKHGVTGAAVGSGLWDGSGYETNLDQFLSEISSGTPPAK